MAPGLRDGCYKEQPQPRAVRISAQNAVAGPNRDLDPMPPVFLRGVASMDDLIIVHETSRDHPMYNPVLQCWNEYSRQSGVADHS